MPRISTKDWRNLPLDRWNPTTVHAMLADLNDARSGVTYEPFGGGSVQQRWATEKGQVKQALTKYGAPTIKRYIELCFANNPKPNPRFPVLSWGFMWAYLRVELSKAQAEILAAGERESSLKLAEERAAAQAEQTDEDWW